MNWSCSIILPATSPRMPPASRMIHGYRFISRASTPDPQTTIGMDSAMPKTTRRMSPSAAAATPITLSRLMMTSATRMTQMAPSRVVPCFTFSPSCASDWSTSLSAIHTSSSPPTTCSRGTASR